MSDEKSLALRVRDVVRELNSAIHEAAGQGIEAEFDVIDRSTIGAMVSERIVTVRLKKVLL